MGKNKGGFNMFESYLASGFATQSPTSIENQHIPLPDSMRTSTLLEQIGKDHKWSEEQIEEDVVTLENNRLYYVSDLRELSKSSWKVIGLLPLVKDLLRNALDPARKDRKARNKQLEDQEYLADKKKKDKKLEKKQKKEMKKHKKRLGEPVVNGEFVSVSEDPETIRNTISNLCVEHDENHSNQRRRTPKKSVSFSEDDIQPMIDTPMQECTSSSCSSSTSSSESEREDKENQPMKPAIKPKIFTGRPIKAISANRIRVQTTDGTIYETDRFCPHKKVDLNTWGQVLGNQLICTKHNWNFNLNGMPSGKGRNINPCQVNDW